MDQAFLWQVPDHLGRWWPGLQSLAAGIAAVMYLVFLLPRTPRNCEGACRFGMCVGSIMIAGGSWNSGLMQWGYQLLLWSIVLYVLCLVWREYAQRPAALEEQLRDVEARARSAAIRAVAESQRRGGSHR